MWKKNVKIPVKLYIIMVAIPKFLRFRLRRTGYAEKCINFFNLGKNVDKLHLHGDWGAYRRCVMHLLANKSYACLKI